MKIAVHTINERGVCQPIQRDLEWAKRAWKRSTDTHPKHLKALDGQVALGQANHKLVVPASVRASLQADMICDRCGEPTELILALDESLRLVPSDTLARTDEEEVELEPEDLDVSFYEDGRIDLELLVAETLMLGLPSRILCTDEAACDTRAAAILQSPEEGGHSAFAALKDL